MRQILDRLLEHPALGRLVVHRRRLEGTPALHGEPRAPLPDLLHEAVRRTGVERLYSHQAAGLDAARAGSDVLVTTPTASGKTLLFAMSVLETVMADPRAKALLLYPTKALAQDQVSALRDLAGGLGALDPPRFEIYDGDTPAARRRKIRAQPPQALLTNPDMLHQGLLARHHEWEAFFRDLRWVVLDELHVYRGIFGAHVHHILNRLQRVCAHYGARPRFIAASGTVGNPAEFARTLVGRPFEVVADSGAARAPLEVLFLNPVAVSPYTVAVRLIAECARAGLRTIVFTKARRITELLYTWLVRQEPQLAGRVAPYRAGYLAAERRELEGRLFRGELQAVITTSALELGIDVGALDACILVGYPGSLVSSWQRIGRIGRAGREGLAALIAMPDALDQYVVRHPELFFGRSFERAVLDPANPFVAGQHLVCAAAEEPLGRAEIEPRALGPVVERLEREGSLVQDAEGQRWFAFRRRPHRDVNVRTTGQPYAIVDARSGRMLGQIDGVRVFHECHPGAIYLHRGQAYHVLKLDLERRRVETEPTRVDYYTVVLGEKETSILERRETRRVGPFHVGLGGLKVTVRIREYQKRRLFGGEPISTHPLEIPPLIYETVGFWIEFPPGLPAAFAGRELHFMGGIHAVEHAVIGLFPLLAIADRGDVGGISYTGHPQIGAPAIFIYDGVAGGAGLCEQGFADLESMLGRTLDLVSDCGCEDGCPGCIQSPLCGNGNRPLDKQAALLTLGLLLERVPLAELDVVPAPQAALRPVPDEPGPAAEEPARRHGIRRAGNVEPATAAAPGSTVLPAADSEPAGRVLVFDLETQRSAEEVGGWGHTDRMGLALAVLFDLEAQRYRTYFEADVDRLLLDLVMADRVVGFNIDRFDLAVLSAYTEWDLRRIRTFDLLGSIHERLGFRISLSHLAEINLGESKTADGLQSLRWWKEGRLDLIEAYCRRDVDVTHRLYQLGRTRGYLLYRDHAERQVRLPVNW